ncbi:MAG: hypothetical protein AAGD11_16680 [Planctomycetota bacterium]
MPSSRVNQSDDGRPDFMVILGLAPPYAVEDVKTAYLAKAKEVHPDHGGSVEAFNELQAAYDRAKHYLEFRSDRRRWIANQMADYLQVGEVVEQLESFGAEVVSESIDWLKQSFGDFAQLTESITSVRLIDSANADAMIGYMVGQTDVLGQLRRLELAGCQVSDEAVLQLEAFQQLEHLDLAGTPITKDALWIVDSILDLESIDISDTSIGWWTRRKVRSVMQKRQAAKPVTPFRSDL